MTFSNYVYEIFIWSVLLNSKSTKLIFVLFWFDCIIIYNLLSIIIFFEI
jgi:hypothetical protein